MKSLDGTPLAPVAIAAIDVVEVLESLDVLDVAGLAGSARVPGLHPHLEGDADGHLADREPRLAAVLREGAPGVPAVGGHLHDVPCKGLDFCEPIFQCFFSNS